MRTVHKFLVPFFSAEAQLLPPLPADPTAPVVHVGVDPRSGQPAIWIEVIPENEVPTEGRRMYAFGTGHDIPAGMKHRGSFIDGPFVWHVYEQVQR
jgi:hypothetical protein